jgi:type II secretory pathway component GspD/PulD (secretin)
MKKITTLSLYGAVLLIFMVAGLSIIPNLNAGTEMDRKIILAMEKIKDEMRDNGKEDNLIVKDDADTIIEEMPIMESETTGLEEEIIPEKIVPESPAPAAVEEPAIEVEKIEESAPVPSEEIPEPEEPSLKDQLDQRGSLKFVDEDIRIVLRSLSKAYGFNVTLAPEVQGKVTVDFDDVKIINALDTILVDQGLGYTISGSILRVTTLDKIQEENTAAAAREAAAAQQAVEEAKKRVAKEAAEPLVVQIFKLKYIDANDAKEAIEPMISPGRGKVMVLQTKQYTGFEFEATESFGADLAEKAATEFVRSRTLIIQDIQTVLDRIDKVIEKIDQRPPQIMIDAKILEVPIDKEFRLGINWTQALDRWQVGARDITATFDRKFERSQLSVDESSRRWGEDNTDYNEAFRRRDINDGTSRGNLSYGGTSSPGSDEDNTLSVPDLVDWTMVDRPGGPYQEQVSWQAAVSNDLANRGYNATQSQDIFDNYLNVISDALTNLTTSGQAYSAVLGAADFTLMLSAMETDSNIVVLSNPRIVVHENYAAKIFVGDRYPILKTEFVAAGGATEGGVSGGGSSIGGTSVDEWREIGITLKVIPQVRELESGGQGINMIIHPAVSDVAAFIEARAPDGSVYPTSYPVISIREADTNVTIDDGDTIVIGGLISSYTVDEEDKIPLLGDIPILGYLFKEEHTKLKKTNLLIFITTRIVTDDMELSNYEKIMLDKSPPDALEDIRYIENEDLRPYLYKSKADLEALKSGEGIEEGSGEENEGEEGIEEEEVPEEEEEENLGNFEGRKLTKANKRNRMR